ncbi:MAG: hypothetical protein GX369_04080 [Euryarchaeota archaeon]|nr:hypothetical protein [Euryarchaeota archaeon]
MRCDVCGVESADEDAYCDECEVAKNASSTLPSAMSKDVSGSIDKYDYPPTPLTPQPPLRKSVPVSSLNLVELLFLISGILLTAAGFQNLGVGVETHFVQFLFLGIVATFLGLIQIALIIMPDIMMEWNRYGSMLTIIIAFVFLIWGMAATFGTNVGVSGGMIFVAGLSTTLGLMVNEGMIR